MKAIRNNRRVYIRPLIFMGMSLILRPSCITNAFSRVHRRRMGVFGRIIPKQQSWSCSALQISAGGGGGEDVYPYSNRNLTKVCEVAQYAARKAGDNMRKNAGIVDILKFKANTRDIVTESDMQCQEIIHSIISQAFPQDGFLGEESAGTGSEASVSALTSALGEKLNNGKEHDDGLLWIVDPIDGTTNFQSGLPLFCASIGVISPITGEIVVGVIYNPILEEMTYAIRGQGCYTNGKRIGGDNTKATIQLSEGLINVGFPAVKESTLIVSSRAVRALATKVKGLRMIACASQVMAWVAQGKLSAYISWDLNSWDVCAGMLIVEEAGGYVSDMDGTKATVESRDLIVSCGGAGRPMEPVGGGDSEQGLHAELLNVLVANDCVKYDP